MSEQESNTPPKPKVGSLKDRIAAFEKSAQSDNTPAQKPLAPRAKPGPISWKPTSSSPKDEIDEPSSDKKHSGMSAEDAKESIAAGGGLKARMAALQGNMNNVGGSPATPPLPAPKPMRKQFVPRPPTPDEEGEEGSENKERPKEPLAPPRRRLDNWDPLAATVAAVSARQRSPSPSGPSEDHRGGHAGVEEQNQEQPQETLEEQEQDEETKERERRAALAARMARLGGARIGMAPPMIPKKPKSAAPVEEEPPVSVKANLPTPVRVLPMPERRATEDSVPTPIEVKETGSDTLRTVAAEDEAISRAAPLPPTSPLTSGDLSERRSYSLHEETSSSQTSLVSSGSHPSSIPLPALPRRAAPPRSKHSARSLKSEQSSHEIDSSETKVTHDTTGAVDEEKIEPEITDTIQSPPIAENPSTPEKEEEGYEFHEESDLTEQVKPSSDDNETAEEKEYNVSREEKEEEGEAGLEEEERHGDEENLVESEKTEEEYEETEAAEEHVSQFHTPQEEEEIPPPPPPRRQESSHSTLSSSKATEPSSSDGNHFFQDAADELDDS